MSEREACNEKCLNVTVNLHSIIDQMFPLDITFEFDNRGSEEGTGVQILHWRFQNVE